MPMLKRLCAAALCVGVLCSLPVIRCAAEENAAPAASTADAQTQLSYTDYLRAAGTNDRPAQTVAVEGEAYRSATESAVVQEASLSGGAGLLTKEGSVVTYAFRVPQAGLYAVRLRYLSRSAKGNSAVRSLAVNGSVPFTAASNLTFLRSFSDILKDGEFDVDAYGNHMTPQAEENDDVLEVWLTDASGNVDGALLFAFSEGENTLTLEGVKEELIIDRIELCQPEKLKSYAELTAGADNADTAADSTIYIEAEKPYKKSANSITPLYDRMSAVTSPQDIDRIYLNMIGGDKWKECGQWLQWRFTVEKAGYYRIVTRYRQDALAGVFVSRRIKLDGEVPCEELNAVRFTYDNGWNVQSVGDGDSAYYFYLDAGEHTLTMEVTLGQIGDVLGKSQECLNRLNEDYRKILAVTGPTPDTVRDYEFDTLIPDVLEDMEAQRQVLDGLVADFEAITGKKGEQTSVLTKITTQLRQMTENPRNIAKLFSPFKDNLAALGNWNFTMSTQPLELDYLLLAGKNVADPEPETGFFRNLWFNLRLVFASFFNDYNNIGSVTKTQEGALNVWIPSGRDQAQILRVLVNSTFVRENNIPVNVKLVTGDSLLPATLARRGPDVALSNGENVPVNYAVRNAVMDLRQFDDCDEVLSRFYPSAYVPFQYDGALYALPENQTFAMMFVRTDIFQQLDLEIPTTWNELLHVMPIIKKQNMDIGVQPGYAGMLTFLYQKGGSIYTDDYTQVTFEGNLAIDSFKRISDLCTLYSLPISYDFANRFRSGEMPLGISDYTVYNQLTVFAPEIQGLWQMLPIPGTVREDGTVDNSAVSSTTGVMILKNCSDPEKAWKFVKWWTSADIQARFGIEMESIVGSAAKQPTANKEALSRLPWKESDYRSLQAQLSKTRGVPVVPGDYIISREVNFAFSDVYNNGANPVDALDERISVINEELARKRREFMKTKQ